ncbi:putative toxin-antitoxin system toxin component, PIN family [Mucilaginibacter arboris]|uniref:Putative toxin-antitoxin system toxin component, PIN family n=1 Tax=Mucilaginibacter arboris TaxID=2682090 RepID=A0A7K1SYZ8_9SPHI|nr:putative toxin-antitoxin system toxin component, PIN family [Mucilaginibacter arboris]MVN22554.1 putative toxin-antitoxin system toxin component, PIN family [Mucilaginibacter arboris]
MKAKSCFVFDTNSLISVALLPLSINKQALQKAERLGNVIFSDETLTELTAVLLRPKFDKYLSVEERLEFIIRIETRYEKVKTISSFTDCRDSKDNIFLNLAVDANASCLISGDKDLLALHPFHNIPIVNAREFLDLF